MSPSLKAFLVAAGALLLLMIGFFALNTYIYSEKQASPDIVSYRGTLQGEFVCLPHVNPDEKTDECAHGLKTDAREYYAVDFSPMSQTLPQITAGERFSANGLITPVEMLSSDRWQQYPIKGIFSVTDTFKKETYECDADAKICPDGSSVGRTGPNCQFAACPAVDRNSADVVTYIGGSPTALNVTVNPTKLVSDSRCPQDVQCIWAGTVEVRTVLSTQVSHGEHVLKLGEPQPFGDYTVTLKNVTPYPKQDENIPESSYRFTFEIKK